jgi:hypothetical protein
VSRGVGLPGALARIVNRPRSRCLFHWRASDGVLSDVLGRAGSIGRASAHGAAIDRLGRLWRPPHSLPAWDLGDADGDGVGETLGLALEGPLSNVFSNPEDLSNAAWAKTNASVGSLSIPGPLIDLTTAQLLTETAINGQHAVTQSQAVTAGEYIYLSGLVRANGRSRCQLNLFNTGLGTNSISATFRLDLGTVSTLSAGVGVVSGTVFRALGGGWYEVGLAGRVDTTATTVSAQLFTVNDSDATSYLGVVGTGLGVTALSFLRCGTSGPTYQRYIGGTGAGPFTRSADVLKWTGAASFPVQDLTLYAKVLRPAWADWTGSLRTSPYILRLGNAYPTIDLVAVKASRNLTVSISDSTPNFATASAAIPAGRVLEVSAQVKGLRTGGQVAIDVGAGLSAFSAALPNPVAALGTTDLFVGNAGTAGFDLDATLLAVKVAPGLRSFTEMQQIL